MPRTLDPARLSNDLAMSVAFLQFFTAVFQAMDTVDPGIWLTRLNMLHACALRPGLRPVYASKDSLPRPLQDSVPPVGWLAPSVVGISPPRDARFSLAHPYGP